MVVELLAEFGSAFARAVCEDVCVARNKNSTLTVHEYVTGCHVLQNFVHSPAKWLTKYEPKSAGSPSPTTREK